MGRALRPSTLILAALFLAHAWTAAGQEPAAAEPWTVLEGRPGEGEQCIVCGQPIHGDEIVEVRYKGRTFHVAAGMLGDFEGDPETYFARLQARAALFDERAMEGRRISTGWLVFGGYVVAGLVFAALCGYLAIARALRPLPWFFAGLVGNVAALFVLLISPRGDAATLPAGVPGGLAKVPVTRSPLPCPECGTPNHPSAAACGGCGSRLRPTVEAETAKA